MKGAISKMLLIPPTEAQLGAVPNYVNNGQGEVAPEYDRKDLLQRYTSAYRMAVLERQSSIELDHNSWQIKSIGSSKLTPEQFVQEIRKRYQAAFADGVNSADQKIASGTSPIGDDVPKELQRGILADQYAQRELRKYLDSIGVPEGPGQLIALNRRAYFQDASGLHGHPDVLIDAGIDQKHILDGKATMFDELSPQMRRQLEGYYQLGVNTVGGVTQRGHVPISRGKMPERRQ